jgi:Zn-finger nucleic acid-binding protein
MNCPNCKAEMTSMTLDAHLSAPVTVDVCIPCQAFWFDKYESLKLAPGSTLKLLKLIGEHSAEAKPAVSAMLQCPRCNLALRFTHDLQRSTRFSYWRCPNDHGRFTSFFDFLREKNFIRSLSAEQIDELKQKVQSVNCANCGAPIDLATASACTHCGTPISILDVKQSQELLDQLKHAAEPKPIDPSLTLDLALVKARLNAELGPDHPKYDSGASEIMDSLSAFARWLTKSDI